MSAISSLKRIAECTFHNSVLLSSHHNRAVEIASLIKRSSAFSFAQSSSRFNSSYWQGKEIRTTPSSWSPNFITKGIDPYRNEEEFLKIAKEAIRYLPAEMVQRLENFKFHRTEENFLHVSGLPIDHDLPPTPGPGPAFPPKGKTSFWSEFLLSVFGCSLGEPFNYIQEENGNLYRNIRPVQANESKQTSENSKVGLELHTETAFHSLRPDYLLLYCLRSDQSGKAFTLASSLKTFIKHLDADTIDALRKPEFKTGIDVSFGNSNRTQLAEEVLPILRGEGDEMTIVYDLDLMVAMTPDAKKAFDQLKIAIVNAQKMVFLKASDLLILDNQRAIHGRTAFDAKFDGTDRWLQRMYVTKNAEFAANIKSSGRIVKKIF